MEIEEAVALSTLPPAIQTAIQSHAGTGKILLVESITKNNAITAYEAHVKMGRKTTEIKVGADGQLISTESDEDEAKEKAARKKHQ